MKAIYTIIALTLTVPIVIFASTLANTGSRNSGKIESIHGIPYPTQNNVIHVQEEMAHTDVYLKEPVFAKNLELTITFNPKNTKKIDVGVRENSFWLSYNKVNLFNGEQENTLITKTVTIPLTDKLQEKDRSIDVMFFADKNTDWEIHSLETSVTYTNPTKAEIKDYIKSILKRERAL